MAGRVLQTSFGLRWEEGQRFHSCDSRRYVCVNLVPPVKESTSDKMGSRSHRMHVAVRGKALTVLDSRRAVPAAQPAAVGRFGATEPSATMGPSAATAHPVTSGRSAASDPPVASRRMVTSGVSAAAELSAATDRSAASEQAVPSILGSRYFRTIVAVDEGLDVLALGWAAPSGTVAASAWPPG